MRVADAGALQHEGNRSVADLSVGRVLPLEQSIDHRVLEVRATPPGDEGIRAARPTFRLEERSGDLGQPGLHVDDCSVLIEHADLDRTSQGFDVVHGSPFS